MNFMNKDESKTIIPAERIEGAIYVIRGNKVLLDRDLAKLYGVETRVLVQAVKRNAERFPADFMFQMTKQEFENWRSQIVISDYNIKMNLHYHPYAFTEQGVAMLSSVLRSPQAVAVNIEIMRAFIRLRHMLASQAEIGRKLTELQSFMLKHANANDREFRRVWQAIEKLAPPQNDKDQGKIGFDLN
jgi:hypothetical protein